MFASARSKTIALIALFLTLAFPCASQTASSRIEPGSSKASAPPLLLKAVVYNRKGNLVTELSRDSFRVFIDNQPANIVDFREEDVPLSVGIIFDASASVGYPQSMRPLIKSSQQALRTLLETSNPANEYFVMAFNLSPQLLLDWSSDSKAVVNTLSTVQPKGNTAFYDACYLALNKVQHGRYSRQVLILITDGQDNVSTYSLKQVSDELKASEVIVYSINFAGAGNAGSALGLEGQLMLEELSSVSGGRFFYQRFGKALTTADASNAFEVIAQELRHQYTIAVMPNVLSDDRKWHKIKIKLEPAANAPETKHLSARTREGFYLNHR